MKGELRLRIFEFIKNTAQSFDDVFFIFSLPYGTSFFRMQYLFDKRRGISFGSASQTKINKQTKRNFNDFLYRLRKDNLIAEAKKDQRHFLGLTPKGKKVLEKLRLNNLPAGKYAIGEEDTWKILIFDIPEKERRKRFWLRNTLKNLKFKMVQKSVWVGKVKLPRQFIRDLDRIDILSYIEIFSITKTGSLKQISGDA
jgi:CRISPR-associated endonuclease Cas2